MQWQDLLGHELQKEWFARALKRGRLATTFLFVGPDGIGKRTFARLLAKSLLCRKTSVSELVSCNRCEDCAQVDASTHPDLIEVAKPVDRAAIPIELLIGEREARMRAGLCHEISLRPFAGRRKVAIIDDADTLGQEGANSLLKTLEEPPLDSVLILISTRLQRQLPTIRSRCQVVRFQPLSETCLSTLIMRQGWVDAPEDAHRLANQAEGSISVARMLSDAELAEFRLNLLERLSTGKIDIVQLASGVSGIAEAAGKEAAARRDRLKLILSMAAEFFRALSFRLEGYAMENDPTLQSFVVQAVESWRGGIQSATDSWHRCLEGIEQIDRNANQATFVEAWSASMAALSKR